MTTNQKTGLLATAIVGGLFFAAAGLVGVLLVARGCPATSPGGSPASSAEDIGYGHQVQNDFIANPINASQKWIGKRVRFKNDVYLISRDHRGRFYLTVGSIFIHPSASDLDKFSTLKVGDSVEVEVTISRFLAKEETSTGLPQIEADDAKLIAVRPPTKR